MPNINLTRADGQEGNLYYGVPPETFRPAEGNIFVTDDTEFESIVEGEHRDHAFVAGNWVQEAFTWSLDQDNALMFESDTGDVEYS